MPIEDLRCELAEPDRIIVVAGTGVSIAMCGDQKVDGFPVARWSGLLRHGLIYGRDSERVFDANRVQRLEPLIDGDVEEMVASPR
jgi:hypothetical protein